MMAHVSHLRPEHKDHVWSYDFMMARTAEGRAFRILTIIDEYTRECLAILTDRRIISQDVIEQLFYLFVSRGIPEHIRSDNGPEFTARAIRSWLNDLGVTTLITRARKSLGEWIHRLVQW